MITLNGKKFAESNSELTGSLFTKQTCVGTAKRLKRQIKLFSLAGEQIGVINRHGVLGKATKGESGKVWYSYADIPEVGRYDDLGKSYEEPKSYAIDSDNLGLIFK